MLETLKRVTVAVCIAGFAVILLLLAFSIQAQGKSISAPTGLSTITPQAITPTILTVRPDIAPNNLDVTIVITGTDFYAVLTGTVVLTEPNVCLDGSMVPMAHWVSSTILTATVPWGLDPGIYTVTVANPDGGIGSLSNAFTVTQAIGVWTTGGPYGGQVGRIVVHPFISTTVYAVAAQVGLFRSINGGESWKLIRASSDPLGLALKPGAPQIILLGDWAGLHQSLNEGSAWQTIFSDSVEAIAYAPSAPIRIYISSSGTIWVSDDDGLTWQPHGNGLPGARIRSIAVHSMTDTTAYIGTEDGRIFKTTDGGGIWQDVGAGLPNQWVTKLVIDPLNPERIYAIGSAWDLLFHRSLDGGATWEPMSIGIGSGLNDLTISSATSGTLYGATCNSVYSSTDAGGTWVKSVDLSDCLRSIELDPDTDAPLYAGGSASGVFRSDDGGVTWEKAEEGMNALQPKAIAASATAPYQVYVAAAHAGSFVSSNAGQSWRTAVADNIMAAAADPARPCVAYMGGASPVYKTTDCGITWNAVLLPTDSSLLKVVLALAVDPHYPDTVYAGMRVSPQTHTNYYEIGKVYSSTDGGANWRQIDFGRPISVVSAIMFDPLVTGTIYIATGTGEGKVETFQAGAVHKSTDNGVHWDVKGNGLSGLPIAAMVVDPSDSNVLYVGVYQEDALTGGGVFKSEDGGDHWQPASSGLEAHGITSLVVDPLAPQTLYAGTLWHGLYQSTNGSVTWTRASGAFGSVGIWCLAAEATTDRTFVYVGTSGGASAGSTALLIHATTQANEVIGAGVYQQTIIHRPLTEKIYLPLVLRSG